MDLIHKKLASFDNLKVSRQKKMKSANLYNVPTDVNHIYELKVNWLEIHIDNVL